MRAGNRGALCSKGASLNQLANNATRVLKPKYRAAGASEWKEVEWDWAFKEIAKRVKKSRDETFVTRNAKGQEVNRCDGIAHVGSAAAERHRKVGLAARSRSCARPSSPWDVSSRRRRFPVALPLSAPSLPASAPSSGSGAAASGLPGRTASFWLAPH